LGRGEASLFLTRGTDRLLLDAVPARVVAESEGRSYVGLLGLLLAGVDTGIVTSNRARQILRGLVQSGFRLAIDLYDEAMEELGKDR